MAINTDSKKIKDVLERGVEQVIEKKHLLKELKSGKRLKIKHGIDPTGPKIHIGRAIQLWKLRAFQELGHQIILIIGDFTAQIGDASDKTSMRKPLTEKEIKGNMKGYVRQIGKILDIDKAIVRYNSEWLSKLKLKDILLLSMHFTAQQMIQRRNFKERWEGGRPIGLHELDYPLLQGYDSVAIEADVEIGGFDQLFNLKAGREIQKIFGQKPQDIMTSKMLYGLDGRKMSTSWGNVINILDPPNEMYGKIMSMKDELIGDYFELCSKIPIEKAELIKGFISSTLISAEEGKRLEEVKKEFGSNPRDIKAVLAKELVELYHGEKAAVGSEEEFNRVFREKKLPSEIPIFQTSKRVYLILDLLKDSGLVSSKSEGKRVILGRGVSLRIKNQESKVKNWREKIRVEDGIIIKVGKRRFVKIRKL